MRFVAQASDAKKVPVLTWASFYVPQTVLSTCVENTCPNHNFDLYYRNPTFYLFKVVRTSWGTLHTKPSAAVESTAAQKMC